MFEQEKLDREADKIVLYVTVQLKNKIVYL